MSFIISQETIREHELKGIIYVMKNTLKITNPIESGWITPSNTSDGRIVGNIGTVVMWNNTQYATCKSNGFPYLQLSFPRGLIRPIAYSLKGVSGNAFSKSWKVFGIQEGKENEDESEWDLLALNNNAQSTYCQNAGFCDNLSIGTFTLDQKLKVGYKHMRWKFNEKSSTDATDCFATSGIDIYGEYSSKSRMNNRNNCLTYRFMRIHALREFICIIFSNYIIE